MPTRNVMHPPTTTHPELLSSERPPTVFVDSTSNNSLYAHILKGGAAVFVLLGIGLVIWLADQWLKHPEMQASQFGNTAPYWPAVIAFVVLSVAAGVMLLWRAARRLETGENLFEERHRKSLKDLNDE